MATMFVPEERIDELKELAAKHGGKPVKGGFRFTGKTEEEVGHKVLVFIHECPPQERKQSFNTAEELKRDRDVERLNKRLLSVIVRGLNEKKSTRRSAAA
jgi:hypothetical protein